MTHRKNKNSSVANEPEHVPVAPTPEATTTAADAVVIPKRKNKSRHRHDDATSKTRSKKNRSAALGDVLPSHLPSSFDDPDPLVAQAYERIGETVKKERPKKRTWRLAVWTSLTLILPGLALLAALYYEMLSSALQSKWFSAYSEHLQHRVDTGRSDAIQFPRQGPFDTRLGYVGLPQFIERLQQLGMRVEQQARMTPEMLQHMAKGYFPPYDEKNQAGLAINDWRGDKLYDFRYPKRQYSDFEAIPSLLVNSLLFIENRDLLQTDYPLRNPSVDWLRFSKAVAFKLGEVLHLDTPSMGASTLATQIEKYRHSPDGITSSNKEKLQQMFSASVRVYSAGRDTYAARKQLVLDYLNTVPLSAAPGFGEVNGIGDGLHVWFDADFAQVNTSLSSQAKSMEEQGQQALALKRVLALMIAHRRPSYYLAQGRSSLQELVNSHLRVLAKERLVSSELATQAQALDLQFRDNQSTPVIVAVDSNKGANVVRTRLANMLGLSLYDLDRLDLAATTTISGGMQDAVSAYLQSLSDPTVAQKAGLFGEHLLYAPEQAAALRFSFLLVESTDYGNRVRVQTDNSGQPFDINEGSKLELGSTAKLRVLTSYLEIIAELHDRFNGMETDALLQTRKQTSDILSLWVLDQLQAQPGIALADLLQLAMERSYSANPADLFYTGGGLLSFRNFRDEDNHRTVTLREATQQSINLPYVRLLRDVSNYLIAQKWHDQNNLIADDSDPRRRQVLAQFIDRDSAVFLTRFWYKYSNQDAKQRLDAFVEGIRPTPVRLAAMYRYLLPDADEKSFGKFLAERMPGSKLAKSELSRLYKRYARGAFSLEDQAYLARVHPLELWLLGYRQENEQATLKQALNDSADLRQQVYGWLLRTKARDARDERVLIALEVEAFSDLHERWKRLGYPFDHLVPSLATALGSSGDRPAALADLMGIIVNDGKYASAVRIEKLQFGVDTPYETQLIQPPRDFRQVMDPVVAATLRSVLNSVVMNGTGRRLQNAYVNADGTPILAGGKTGTGDNRLFELGPNGERIKSRAVNRTATIVFYLGAHHFGVLTAFVDGSKAGNFHFTSALPVQVLKSMAPLLQKHLTESELRQSLRAVIKDDVPELPSGDSESEGSEPAAETTDAPYQGPLPVMEPAPPGEIVEPVGVDDE